LGALIATIALTIVGLTAYIAFYTRNLDELRRLLAAGKVLKADITDTRHYTGKGAHYEVAYEYEYSGSVTSARDTVDSDLYNSVAVGSQYPVTVLPSSPEIHRLGLVDEMRVAQGQTTLVAGVVILFLAGLGISVGMIVLYSNERNMIDHAEPAKAIVVSNQLVSGSRGSQHRVVYRFSDRSGVERERSCTVTTRRSHEAEEGYTVLALYWPDQEENSRIVQEFNLAEPVEE
jgi:hypothetical protein